MKINIEQLRNELSLCKKMRWALTHIPNKCLMEAYHEHQLVFDWLEQWLQAIEQKQMTEAEAIEIAKRFLALRWQFIQCSLLDYTYNLNFSANQACIAVAQMIAGPEESVLQLLMPTVQEIVGDANFGVIPLKEMTEREGHLQLWSYLTSTSQRLLDVQSIFHYGRLDPAYLFSPSSEETASVQGYFQLSAQDMDLLSKSAGVTSQNFLQELQDLQQQQSNTTTVGYALQQLAHQLRAGSVKGSGAELQADSQVIGSFVKLFYDYWQQLPEAIRKQAENLRLSIEPLCLRDYLLRIFYADPYIPLSDEEKSQVQAAGILDCAELLANTLERFLRVKPCLYQMTTATHQSFRQSLLENAETNLVNTLQKERVPILGEDGFIRTHGATWRAWAPLCFVPQRVWEQLPILRAPHLKAQLQAASTPHVLLLPNLDALVQLFKAIDNKETQRWVSDLNDQIQALITTPEDFIAVLRQLAPHQWRAITDTVKDKLWHWITHSALLWQVVEQLPAWQWPLFRAVLQANPPGINQKIIGSFALSQLFRSRPATEWHLLWTLLGEQVQALIPHLDQLSHFVLSVNKEEPVFNATVEPLLTRMIPNTATAGQFLNSLPAFWWAQWFSYYTQHRVPEMPQAQLLACWFQQLAPNKYLEFRQCFAAYMPAVIQEDKTILLRLLRQLPNQECESWVRQLHAGSSAWIHSYAELINVVALLPNELGQELLSCYSHKLTAHYKTGYPFITALQAIAQPDQRIRVVRELGQKIPQLIQSYTHLELLLMALPVGDRWTAVQQLVPVVRRLAQTPDDWIALMMLLPTTQYIQFITQFEQEWCTPRTLIARMQQLLPTLYDRIDPTQAHRVIEKVRVALVQHRKVNGITPVQRDNNSPEAAGRQAIIQLLDAYAHPPLFSMNWRHDHLQTFAHRMARYLEQGVSQQWSMEQCYRYIARQAKAVTMNQHGTFCGVLAKIAAMQQPIATQENVARAQLSTASPAA